MKEELELDVVSNLVENPKSTVKLIKEEVETFIDKSNDSSQIIKQEIKEIFEAEPAKEMGGMLLLDVCLLSNLMSFIPRHYLNI